MVRLGESRVKMSNEEPTGKRSMPYFETLERIKGFGELCREDGQLIGEVEYSIVVLQEMLDEGNAGLEVVEGDIDDSVDLFSLVGESLVLHLEDGRRMDMFIADTEGRIENRGKPWYET